MRFGAVCEVGLRTQVQIDLCDGSSAAGLADSLRSSYAEGMSGVGTRIDESGMLLREGGGFVLRRDLGGRWLLDLHRVPVDHVEKRVRVSGTIVGDGLVDVDGVAPELA